MKQQNTDQNLSPFVLDDGATDDEFTTDPAGDDPFLAYDRAQSRETNLERESASDGDSRSTSGVRAG